MQPSYSLSAVWAVILRVRPLLRVLVARGLLVGLLPTALRAGRLILRTDACYRVFFRLALLGQITAFGSFGPGVFAFVFFLVHVRFC